MLNTPRELCRCPPITPASLRFQLLWRGEQGLLGSTYLFPDVRGPLQLCLSLYASANPVVGYESPLCCREQELDMFGEICGIAFTPDDSRLMVSIQDEHYGGFLLHQRGLAPQFGR